MSKPFKIYKECPKPFSQAALDSYLINFYNRYAAKALLDKQISSCRECQGLNEFGKTESAPGFGSLTASVMFIGQSLCNQCMATKIPFTRNSGDLLDRAILEAGFQKFEVFTTNVNHCHPPNNRGCTKEEKKNCSPFLAREITIIKPRLIVCLGGDAKQALREFGAQFNQIPFKPKSTVLFGAIKPFKVLIAWANHPSYVLYRSGRQEVIQEWVDGIRSLVAQYEKRITAANLGL